MPALVHEKLEQFSICLWDIQEDVSFFQEHLDYVPLASHPSIALQQFGSRMALKSLQHDFPFHLVNKKASQQPFLPDDTLHFSYSHCLGFGAAALSKENAVGVDVERISDRVIKVMPRFLNSNEEKFIHSQPRAIQVRYATLFWSIKEAAFKAFGQSGIEFKQDISIHIQQHSTQIDFLVEFRMAPSIFHSVYYKPICDIWLTALWLKK